MALVVNTNVHSLAAQRNLTRTMSDLETAMQRLSSGLRINMAKDDAAGLAVAQRMEGQARGAAMAQRTIGDGISYLGIADSTLRNINDSLQRMRELAIQAATETYTSSDRLKMEVEFQQLRAEISGSEVRGTFNSRQVVGNSAVNVVIDSNAGRITISGGQSVAQYFTTSLAAGGILTLSGGTGANAVSSLQMISGALEQLASSLASVGAYQSRMEKALGNAMAVEEAQWTARGRIMDADFAKETSRMTSAQVVQQAGVSALAQANQIPQMALGLLQ
ncbi:flagellin FliC [Magnetovirga frankeli]|uniref:flagellin N-terminal helical domain-containing protein n=1 Tax=Magnetovirga frankeli TaxID=947516 RepID=UPI0012930342|nr:flagellin FliC [gamma proteobacterium SS-5]